MKKYKYHNSDKIFELKESNGFIYRFVCGHWCTDNVFLDLIDVSTGRYNYEGKQLTLTL